MEFDNKSWIEKHKEQLQKLKTLDDVKYYVCQNHPRWGLVQLGLPPGAWDLCLEGNPEKLAPYVDAATMARPDLCLLPNPAPLIPFYHFYDYARFAYLGLYGNRPEALALLKNARRQTRI